MATLNENIQRNWENTIKIVLKNKNPCAECLVGPRCSKSFSEHSACEKLAKALEEELEILRNEN